MVVEQYLEGYLQMKKVLFKGAAENQNIIEEDDDEAAKVGLEKHVYCSLERRRHITEAEWHHSKLIMTIMSSKCCLRNIPGVHYDLMVTL